MNMSGTRVPGALFEVLVVLNNRRVKFLDREMAVRPKPRHVGLLVRKERRIHELAVLSIRMIIRLGTIDVLGDPGSGEKRENEVSGDERVWILWRKPGVADKPTSAMEDLEGSDCLSGNDPTLELRNGYIVHVRPRGVGPLIENPTLRQRINDEHYE